MSFVPKNYVMQEFQKISNKMLEIEENSKLKELFSFLERNYFLNVDDSIQKWNAFERLQSTFNYQ